MVCSKVLLGGKIVFVTYLTHSLVSVLIKHWRLVLLILLHSHPFELASSTYHHHLTTLLLFFHISEITEDNYIWSEK